MSRFGLIGRNIGYSFSRNYFSKKFERENLPHSYENFDLENLNNIASVFKQRDLRGLNVTIPYKKEIIPFLDAIDPVAAEIGAVNTIKIHEDGRTEGFNTDYLGFQQALQEFLPLKTRTALILGTGGASNAIAYALRDWDFEVSFVSRTKKRNQFCYDDLDSYSIQSHHLIVNCTPLGTFPNTEDYPNIPYRFLTEDHLLFDLIYNPAETEFLKKGKALGTNTSNGLGMLVNQAETAWNIWNDRE